MRVDFDRSIDRRCTRDLKWRAESAQGYLGTPIKQDMLPMWIADMDFACPQVLYDAIRARTDKEIFGYCAPDKDYFAALCYWMRECHGWEIDPAWICTTPTVVAAINIAIRTFTNEGDGIIIQQPVYDPFATLVKRTGRRIVNNALLCKDGAYTMDFELLERQAANPDTKLMVFCSPHNPVGRVWTREELVRLDDICRKNHVIIVSDEIHSDIVLGGHKHTVLPMLSEGALANTILCTAPGKTFNVAGLKISNIIIADAEMRKAFNEQQLNMSLDVRNTFGIEAVAAVYSPEGKAWVEQLLEYLDGSVELIEKAVKDMPGVTFTRPEGTFLGWLNFAGTGLSDSELREKIIVEEAVICTPGVWFGPGGEKYLRLNFGCTHGTLTEAMSRICKVINERGE